MVGTENDESRGSGLDRRWLLGASAAVVGAAAVAATLVGGDGEGKPAAGSAEPAQHSGSASGAASAHPTATEQDLPGDPGWRLASAGPQNAIEGYTDKVSVLSGESVGLRVSTTSGSFRVSAYRMGWYGGAEARLVWRSGRVPGGAQSAARFDAATRTVYTEWHDSLTLSTKGWPEGAYLLRLEADSGHQRYTPLIVRSPSASGAGKIVIMHAPATWQAYNLWGGYSLYQGENGAYDTRSYAASFDRPYDAVGAEKFLVYERALVSLAERMRLPVAYTTGIDVHNDPSILAGARAVISLGHDEYWTPQQRRHVTQARDAGVNVAFLGANTCFRRIRFDPSPTGADRKVVCYKTSYERDPVYGRESAQVTTDYRAAPAADPESSMTGVLYEGYPTDAPFVVHSADHWLYEGTGVKNGDSFAHLVGVEYDRVTPDQPTPRPIQVIAHSPLKCNGKSSHSDAAYYTVPSGAGVFASGTMRWVEGLMAGTRDDGGDHGMNARTATFVTRVTENLLTAFAAGPAAHVRPTPRDNVHEVYS